MPYGLTSEQMERNAQIVRETQDAIDAGLQRQQARIAARERDVVNHPSHYTAHPSGIECITVTEHMNFNRGNAVKYIWRAGEKGSEVEDLKKARWYIAREIARLESERNK